MSPGQAPHTQHHICPGLSGSQGSGLVYLRSHTHIYKAPPARPGVSQNVQGFGAPWPRTGPAEASHTGPPRWPRPCPESLGTSQTLQGLLGPVAQGRSGQLQLLGPS